MKRARFILLLFFLACSSGLFSQRIYSKEILTPDDSLRRPILDELSLSYYYNRIAGINFSVQQFSAPAFKVGVFLGRGFLCNEATLHSVFTYYHFIQVPGQGISYGIRVTTPGKFKAGLGLHYGLFFTSNDYVLMRGIPELFFGYKHLFLGFQVDTPPRSGHVLGKTYLGFKKDMNFSATFYIPLYYKIAPKVQYKRKYWNEIESGKWTRMKRCEN